MLNLVITAWLISGIILLAMSIAALLMVIGGKDDD